MSKDKGMISANVFEETYDEVTILPDNRWSVFVNFKLMASDGKVHHENIYTFVCSRAYAKNPADEPVDEKTIMLEYLDKDYIQQYIETIVTGLNALSLPDWAQYYAQLERHFHIDES